MSDKPLVSICCITFNHARYVRQCLDGFVMQRTSFPFEIIIHDDASTDDTQEIIREYIAEYPDLFKPILQEENQYSKGIRSILATFCYPHAKGKYIALCEGDDYWTDPEKLQMQVDFLEANPEYSMCFHNVDVLNEDTQSIDTGCDHIETRDYDHAEIQEKLLVPTCSVLFRTDSLKNYEYDKDYIVGDNVLWATCRSTGKVRGFDRVMGVYRRVSTGWTAQFTKIGKQKYYDLNFAWIKHRQAMKRHFPDIKPQILDKIIMENMAIISILDARIYRRNFSKNFKQFYSEYGIRYVGAIAKVIANSASNKVKAILHRS